jgi:Methyltransferase domain
MENAARGKFLEMLRAAVAAGALAKLTLGRHQGADKTLRNLYVRPVSLAAGPRLSLVWRHATRDITKNHPPQEALALVEPLIGRDFLDAHLFASGKAAQLECEPGGKDRLTVNEAADAPSTSQAHDRPRARLIPPGAPWLRALGVTNEAGRTKEGMGPKLRQIEKFAELLMHLVGEAGLAGHPALSVADMGCGKGYLTFAVAAVLGTRARVRGVEARPELVALCNRVAVACGMAPALSFEAGTIAGTGIGGTDIVIALHACDTATDDALAKGIEAGAGLILAAPCCQKELRPQLRAPDVLAGAFRHGIFLERQAEFATDALRAQLLEWAGYRTRAFEFVSTEHTAKNLMLAATRGGEAHGEDTARRIREFAAFYGIRSQALASRLGFDLQS